MTPFCYHCDSWSNSLVKPYWNPFLLKDKKATAHPSALNKLKDGAVNDAVVVIDGKVITSEGLATVTDFALAIVSKLFGNGRARSVAEGLVFEYPRK